MLPANLAKTRAAGRGAYGELLVLNAGPLTGGGAASALRYAPYPVPATLPQALGPSAHAAAALPVAAIAVAPATPLHYASAALYDVAGCKRVFATSAAALRPHLAHRGPPALTYSMSDLLGVQGLDIPAVYANTLPAGLGL